MDSNVQFYNLLSIDLEGRNREKILVVDQIERIEDAQKTPLFNYHPILAETFFQGR